MKWQKDNWGDRARFGLFIVSSEAVPEAEWWAMLPEGVSVHAARITAHTPWARWQVDRSDVDLAEDLSRGLQQFSNMRLNAVVIGHSSSSFLGGKKWDETVIQHLSRTLGGDVSVTTNGLDMRLAIEAMQIKRPYLVLPAWFDDQTVASGLRYFQDHQVTLSGYLRYDPGAKWRDFPPRELYPRGMGFAQAIEPLFSQIVTACPNDADGVLIAGTGFRSVAILEALEQTLKRPVISANQASLWRCLKLADISAEITGYGNLLQC